MKSDEELIHAKERHLKDLKDCAQIKRVGNWVWVGATIKRLEREIKELKQSISKRVGCSNPKGDEQKVIKN